MKKALIIDDDPNILTTLEMYLEDKGLEVVTASSAETGIQSFRRETPDLVFLDMKLPDRNGLEALKDIITSGIKTQVLMITAYATIETAVRAVKMGAFDYIPKPFSPGPTGPCPGTVETISGYGGGDRDPQGDLLRGRNTDAQPEDAKDSADGTSGG